jgi:general secretion pathway protein G
MMLPLALSLLCALQDAKPVQGRDEILKQDIEAAIKKLGSERFVESLQGQDELKELGRRAIPAVVAELGKKDQKPAVKRALCEVLGGIREANRDAVAALKARLSDSDEYGVSIASAAARALTAIGDDSVSGALLDVLKGKAVDADRPLKYEAIRAMGVFRVADAVEILRKALEDKKPASAGDNDDAPLIASAAADALGLIRAQAAVEDLGGKLSDTTNDPSTAQSLGVHSARALQRILEHELRGKAEKDEARAGVLAGEAEDVRKTLEAWQKWWTSKSAKKNIEDTKGRIAKLNEAVEAYRKAQGALPLILEHLKTKPEKAKDFPKDGYYQGELKDAWGRNFVYREKGTGADFDIVSFGADGRTWGAAEGADLWNHDKWRDAKKAETKKAMDEALKAVEQFKKDNERLPEKLIDLVQRPTYPVKNYPKDPYLKTTPKDGYDNFLIYRVPGTSGEAFDLVSYGADGIEGGEAENEDTWNHDKRPAKKDEKK